MKVTNTSRILNLGKRVGVLFVALVVAITFSIIVMQEKKEMLIGLVDPKYLGHNIVETFFFVTLFSFLILSIFFTYRTFQILRKEYFKVMPDFIEGPTRDGRRIVLSFSQITYIGKDLLGEFSIQSNEGVITLPGKLTLSLEREIKRKIQSARFQKP